METPEKFKNLAEAVRNEVYGKDVREAIAKSIEETGTSSETAIKITEQLIDGSFDEAELTTEIEQRLEQLEQDYAPELNNVKSQLAQTEDHFDKKINENHNEVLYQLSRKVDEVALEESTINFYAEGVLVRSVGLAEAGNASEVQDYIDSLVVEGQIDGLRIGEKAVKPSNTTFFDQSVNLFDIDKVVRNTVISSSDGTLIDSDNYHTSDLIEVKPNTSYTMYGFYFYGLYDKDANFITRNTTDSAGSNYTIQTDGAHYIRVSYNEGFTNVDYNRLQISEGDTMPPYEPYYLRLSENIYVGGGGVRKTIPVHFEVAGLNHETGMISVAEDRDYESNRRTGNFLKVIPATSVVPVFDKGSVFVFEYEADFSFIRATEANTNLSLSASTHLVKLTVEGLNADDFVGCELTFTSPTSTSEWVKNPFSEGNHRNNISFTYEVNTNVGRDIFDTDSNAEQYTHERYYNSALLRLPPNYSATGKPVKLIIWNNGAGGYSSFENSSFNWNYDDYFQYLADEGYAILGVYSWTTKYPEVSQENFGSPTTISAIVQAYKWVVDNFNIDDTGAFISGKSAGGYTGLNLVHNKGIPVLAAGLLAPAISPLTRPYGYDLESRIAYADDFGFEGNTNILDGPYPERTEELKDFIINNAEKMVGYNPFWNGLVGESLTTLATYGAEEEETNYSNYENMTRISSVPTKIWISEDDVAVDWNIPRAYIKTIKNGQGIGELRLMPNGTGGHNSVDMHEDALKVDSITTRLGIEHIDVPLAYVELVHFFRRYEN